MENLIYDRTQEDVNYALNNPNSSSFLKGSYNYVDLNRIETWCEHLEEQLNLYNYSVNITTKTNWTMNDFPNKVEMKRIRDNVEKLKIAFVSFTQVPSNLEKMTYQKANEIEKVLEEIFTILNGMENYLVYSGVSNSGQIRMWQNRFRRKYNHVLNILADGRFKNISSNYQTNSLARIYNQDGYTTYEMTRNGTSGYIYNIYTRATFSLEANHTYMYIARWRNTENYPLNTLGYFIRNSSGTIKSGRFNSHGLEWKTEYITYTPSSAYSNVQIGINGSDLNQGANFDIEYQAFIDITELNEQYTEVVKQKTDKMIAFPKVNGALMMIRGEESEGDLVE